MNEVEEPYARIDIAPIRSAAHLTWSLTAIIGVPANIFVLVAIVYFRDMRTISNIYIFNLALADLLFLSGIPITIFGQSSQGDWQLGSTMCKLFISGNAISQFASAVFIAILSFDRFLAVCRPIVSSSWRTTHAAFAFSVSAWVMVILEMTPLLLFVKLIKIKTGEDQVKRTCMLFVGSDTVLDFSSNISAHHLGEVENNMLTSRRFFISYTFALSYLIPLIAVWFFYVKIIIKMCKRRRQMYIKRTVAKRKTTKVSSRCLFFLSLKNIDFSVTVMGLAIVTSYTHCWLPFWIVQWSIELNAFDRSPFLLICVSYFAFALQYINSAANPFLYVFLSDSFKKNITKLFKNSKPDKQRILKNSNNIPSDGTKMLVAHNIQTCLSSSQQSTC